MVLGPEAGGPGDLRRRRLHRLLEPGRRGHVLDHPTVGADQMVVMTGEVLGELEPRVLVVGDDPVHETGLLEHDEIAVHRALREVTARRQDLGNGQWPRRGREHLDDRLAVGGEALVDPA
jgi:hypothetical protein